MTEETTRQTTSPWICRHLESCGWVEARPGRWHHERLNRHPHRPRLWTLDQAIAWQLDWNAKDRGNA